MRKHHIWLISSLILIVLSALAWSTELATEWGIDYGVYYVGSSLLDSDYALYREHFTHKGPAYYAFLQSIGFVIGYGPLPAIVSLFATAFIYLLANVMIAKRMISGALGPAIGAIIGSATLIFQPSNASIALFQTAPLLVFLYTLYRFNISGRLFFLVVASISFSVAVLTRIDSAAFGVLYLTLALFVRERLFRTLGLAATCQAAALLILYLAFRSVYGFTDLQYFDHNIIFNFAYAGPIRQATTLASYLGIVLILIFSGIGILLLSTTLTFVRTESDTNEKVFLSSVLLVSVLFYLFLLSGKNYHLFVLYPGVLFFLYGVWRRVGHIRVNRIAMAICVISTFAWLLVETVDRVASASAIANPTLVGETDRAVTQVLANSKGNVHILNNRSWLYFFASRDPVLPLNPIVLYQYSDLTEYMDLSVHIRLHNELLNDSGALLAISPEFANADSPWLHELLQSSETVGVIESSNENKLNPSYLIRRIKH